MDSSMINSSISFLAAFNAFVHENQSTSTSTSITVLSLRYWDDRSSGLRVVVVVVVVVERLPKILSQAEAWYPSST
eukprot:CAMPEP_0172440128 /NCGR_PEP_ID=MMETSP1065-20121228/879_1 /TAXON_ID=265537 /ORGANISM="Amphiprora paludosa, Strain CCMP125" /LENGTH=75 /DNA_ID=CAMNT_0013188911 /DNA_START=49 /DNA_END=272 /DNA_ORIENTATION=-